jgi:hypothetical protein
MVFYAATRSGCVNRQGFRNAQEDDSTVSSSVDKPLFVPRFMPGFFEF